MMRCQFKTCGMPAKWRVQIGPVQDGNACRKHAKHRPRIFKLTAEAEADLRFIRSALDLHRLRGLPINKTRSESNE
jgi:hypothetical protein